MASQQLVDVNSATLGAKMPEIELPDGTKVQTGTVGALIVNVKLYNKAVASGDEPAMALLQQKIRLAVPLLRKAGMFELFAPEEWAAGSNAGRKLVADEYHRTSET